MNLDRLRYFSVVAETVSLRRAAEILRVTPPALSKAIKQLEGEMECRLIVPSGRGILITDQGKILAARARQLLDDAAALKSAVMHSAPGEARTLRIGSFEVFSTYFLGVLLKQHLGERAVTLHELSPGHLEQALIERHIDLGITYIPVPSPEIDSVRVSTIEMGVFAAKGAFPRTSIGELPFVVPVMPISGSPDRVRGSDGWPDTAPPRLVKYQVTLMESALELCRQGLAAAYLPKFIVRLHNERVTEERRLSEVARDFAGSAGAQPVYVLKRKTDLEEDWLRKTARALRIECGKGS